MLTEGLVNFLLNSMDGENFLEIAALAAEGVESALASVDAIRTAAAEAIARAEAVARFGMKPP